MPVAKAEELSLVSWDVREKIFPETDKADKPASSTGDDVDEEESSSQSNRSCTTVRSATVAGPLREHLPPARCGSSTARSCVALKFYHQDYFNWAEAL